MADHSNLEEIKCSFCSKDKDLVERLIAGSFGGYICNACVELCREMLNESEAKHTDFPRLTNGADSQKFSNCSFCNEDGNQVKKLIASDMAAICDECVDLCKEILAELDEEIKEAPNV